jgi:RNase P subunit RPR2
MRQGCISLGEIQCDECHRLIPHSERYLLIEEDGADAEESKTTNYCVECALQKDYAYYKEEKGERILTFFPKLEY